MSTRIRKQRRDGKSEATSREDLEEAAKDETQKARHRRERESVCTGANGDKQNEKGSKYRMRTNRMAIAIIGAAIAGWMIRGCGAFGLSDAPEMMQTGRSDP